MIWAQENDKRADACGVGEGPGVFLLGRFCSAPDHTQTRRQTCMQKAQGELSPTFILKFIGYCFYLFRVKNPQKCQGGFLFVFFPLDVHSCSPHHNFPAKVCRKKRRSWQHLVEWTCSQRTKLHFSTINTAKQRHICSYQGTGPKK